jgi:sulfoxide reductase heme-binding subunit YedZ
VGLAYQGELGVRPVTEAIRISGDWALRLFWLVLLVSPARRLLAAPRLIRARRILGLGAFGLTALHFGLYALDQQFDWIEVGLEVLLRTYLTFGAAAMIGLAVLAASSSDGAVSRLGGARWNRLHQGVYAIAALSLVHFLLRSRTNTFEPMLMFGLFAWLMGYRLTHRFAGDVTPARLLGLAVAAAALTATVETCWHAAATGVDARADSRRSSRHRLWAAAGLVGACRRGRGRCPLPDLGPRGRLARYRSAAAGAASPVVGHRCGRDAPAVPGQGGGRRVSRLSGQSPA